MKAKNRRSTRHATNNYQLPKRWGQLQGCQMVCFQTKNTKLVKFWRVLQWKLLVYFMDIWSILRSFSIHVFWLISIFSPFWYIVPIKIWQPWPNPPKWIIWSVLLRSPNELYSFKRTCNIWFLLSRSFPTTFFQLTKDHEARIIS
jgi:hypothetical protein